jgi:hypothetical protein
MVITHTHIKGGLEEDHLSLKEDQRRITKGGSKEGRAHKDFVKHSLKTHTKGGSKEDWLSLKEEVRRRTKGG